MSGYAWRRAGRAELPALAAFLEEREERCAGFTGRLLREAVQAPPQAAEGAAPPSASRLRLPASIRGGVWIAEAERGGPLAGALLCHPSGLAFPIFPSGPAVDEAGEAPAEGGLARELARLSAGRIWRAASATGLASDVDRLEAAAGLEAIVEVKYLLMSLPARAAAGEDSRGTKEGILSLRRAGPGDLDALYPLQEAYEREEVLTPIHDFNPSACRAALARALELQRIYLAEERGSHGAGRVVAKAGTNARGFRVDQIGGVFTLPEWRGRGAASSLMAALLGEIGGAGRGAVLFVKPGNAAALALYRGLGFEPLGDYRADYFSP